MPGFQTRTGAGGPPPEALPDPHAYKPPDWIPGANFLYKTNRIFDNAFTGGAADYLTAKAGDLARRWGISNTTPSVAQLRAETKQDRTDVGPVASTIADTAGYGMGVGKVLGPLAGKLAPVAGRYGAAAVEGMGANAVDAFGNHLGSDQPINYWDTGKHIVSGAVNGVIGQGAGDLTAGLTRRVGNYVQGLPGRGGEQWDWRGLSPAETQAKIDNYRANAPAATVAPGTPADKALTNTSSAVSQSVEPGPTARIVQGATGAVAGAYGLPDNITEGITGGLGIGALTSKFVGDPLARGVNTFDKNISVGQSLDKLYPALTGQQSTVDVSQWPDALRRAWIGQQAQP